VNVLVRVYVRYGDTGLLKAFDLRSNFRLHLLRSKSSAKCCLCNCRKAGRELGSIRQQTGNAIRLKDWLAIHQYDVASDSKAGKRPGELSRVAELPAIRHQSCGSNDAVLVRVGDGAIYA